MTEAEAQEKADNKIKNVNKLAEREKNQKWVDITTGKKDTPKNPY
jgi:L-rhamnose mutarotase